MTEYHKIQTVFMRDPATKHKTLLPGQWSLPEFGYLAGNEWEWTEKVDGTNIRVIVDCDGDGNAAGVRYGGKTDNAQIPTKLLQRLRERFDNSVPLRELGPCVLYGEGYGAGIQSGGTYRPDQDFILFDVNICGWWLARDNVNDIGAKLGVPCVPVIRRGTLLEAVEQVRSGFGSYVGNGIAEGLVMRPVCELRSRSGERIIAKIKHKDFAK